MHSKWSGTGRSQVYVYNIYIYTDKVPQPTLILDNIQIEKCGKCELIKLFRWNWVLLSVGPQDSKTWVFSKRNKFIDKVVENWNARIKHLWDIPLGSAGTAGLRLKLTKRSHWVWWDWNTKGIQWRPNHQETWIFPQGTFLLIKIKIARHGDMVKRLN